MCTSGIPADAIHGNKSQNHRERVLAAFRTGEIRMLVATDIAARGIDVDGISHVVNFDLPNIPETYVHRIGRTARAGADGIAISLCAGEEMAYLRDIEKLIRVALPKEDRRTPGQRDSCSGTVAEPGRPSSGAALATHRGAMQPAAKQTVRAAETVRLPNGAPQGHRFEGNCRTATAPMATVRTIVAPKAIARAAARRDRQHQRRPERW